MVHLNKGNLHAHSVCKHLEENNVIIKKQHGFIKNKSCQTNLISFFDFLQAECEHSGYFNYRKTLDVTSEYS